MTKSRSGPLFFLAPALAVAAWPATAQTSPPIDADTLIAHQRQELRDGARLDCPPDTPDDIVVCARRRTQTPRAPLPYAPEEGQRLRDEPPPDFGCIRLCEQPLRVGVGRAIGFIGRAIRTLRERTD